jgi:hypothetical protein
VNPSGEIQHPSAAHAGTERSVGELFGELATEMSTLVRQEMKLATTEATHKATFVLRQSLTIAIGALAAQAGAVLLGASLALGLGQFLPLWIAALLVSVVFAGVATGIVSSGVRALRRMDPVLTQTVASVADNARWAQDQVR